MTGNPYRRDKDFRYFQPSRKTHNKGRFPNPGNLDQPSDFAGDAAAFGRSQGALTQFMLAGQMNMEFQKSLRQLRKPCMPVQPIGTGVLQARGADSHTRTGGRSRRLPWPIAGTVVSGRANRSWEGRNKRDLPWIGPPPGPDPSGRRGKSMAFESSRGAGVETLCSIAAVHMAESTATGGLPIGQES